MSVFHKCLYAMVLVLAAGVVQADFTVELDGGDRLEVHEFGAQGQGPLFLWLVNQYGELETPNALIQTLAERGATVWRTDLLDSLLLQRSSEAIRRMDGAPVAALLDAAVRSGRGPIVLVTCDRMTVPLLRGLRTWQEGGGDSTAVAGGILLFPNLYRGTPVAGEEPELLGIVAATNMPVAIFQPAMGSNRDRLDPLLATFHEAGSPAYAWMIDGVRDYYLLHSDQPENKALDTTTAGAMPPEVRQAIMDTPNQLLEATRLLAGAPRPAEAAVLDERAETPIVPAYGLVKREPRPAPGYALVDARGDHHELADSLGRVTLVNFWATWCPPCVHEIPSMNRLAAAYDEREFGIVSINYREEPEHILEFMREVEVDFPVLMDEDGQVSGDWGVFALPSSFILDRQGRIRYSVNTAIEWDTDAVRQVIDALRKDPPGVGPTQLIVID